MSRKSNLSLLLERLPEKHTQVIEDTLTDFLAIEDPIARRVKFRASYPSKVERFFVKSENRFFFATRYTRLERSGSRIYTKTSWGDRLIIEGNRCTLKDSAGRHALDERFLESLFSFVGIEWATRLVRDCEFNHERTFGVALPFLLSRPAIVRDILYGKITSFEGMVRAYAKSCGFKTVDWKVFRDYINLYSRPVSLADILEFTTNPMEAMRYFVEHRDDREMADAITEAGILGRKVNPLWSRRRLLREHTRSSREILAYTLGSKSDKPIYDSVDESAFKPFGVTLLNTERQVYTEANMQKNCLYSCYMGKCSGHRYIPFHISCEDEEATFGIQLSGDDPVIEQVKLAYNRQPSEKTRKVVEIFLTSFSDLFRRMLVKGDEQPLPSAFAHPVAVEEDIPF